MPLFGAHQSIAGGYHNALLTAQALQCDTVQLFTKNNMQWRAKDISDDDVRTFKRVLRQTRLRLPVAHNCYLINIASADAELYRKSLESLIVEVQRAEALGLRYLVMHPGSPVDCDETEGVSRVVQALDEVHRRCAGARVRILLETTAGQGSCLGHRFEHLAAILEQVDETERVGVCFDTCHVFAAGYPLAPEPAYRSTMRQFDRIIGLGRLKAFHMNDSQKPLGSRIDRHAHIGRGCLGLEPFRLLINDRRFRRHPMLLETPKEDGRRDMDRINLRTLRRQVVIQEKLNGRKTPCGPR